MRTIKFRGFHADENGKTVIKLDGKEIKGTWYKGDLSTDGGYYIQAHAVLPETVGQYIGLDDKNEKEIFEGDIVSDGWSTGCVKYDEFNCTCCNGVYGWIFVHGDIRDYTDYFTVGNIFENPELMEVEE